MWNIGDFGRCIEIVLEEVFDRVLVGMRFGVWRRIMWRGSMGRAYGVVIIVRGDGCGWAMGVGVV